MKARILIIALVCLGSSVFSQDIHFTQFFATPMFTNPAFTGHFEGTYRFSGIIRNQWASISPQPYRTFGGAIDVNAPLNLKPFGAGIHFAQDNAGLSNLTTTQVNAFLSGKIALSSQIKLHIGGMGGIFQNTIDYSKLSFGDQFNGIRYDPELETSENTSVNASINQINFAGGAYLERRVTERQRIGVGYSLFNILEPDRAFFQSTETLLDRRNNIHILSSFYLAPAWDLMPAAQFMQQGKQNELLIGTAVRYHLSTSEINPQSVQLGVWGRTSDAANISAGVQLNNLYLGGAYDVNLSSLKPATSYRGGWEFAVIYTLATVREKVKRLRQCPDYL